MKGTSIVGWENDASINQMVESRANGTIIQLTNLDA